MTENKIDRSKQFRTVINMNDPYEILYMQQKFPTLSIRQILHAIVHKGPVRHSVVRYLRENQHRHWK